jgi:hypothetical protein
MRFHRVTKCSVSRGPYEGSGEVLRRLAHASQKHWEKLREKVIAGWGCPVSATVKASKNTKGHAVGGADSGCRTLRSVFGEQADQRRTV